jgi:energy-converting hydrogenase Eha subunit H
MNWIIDQIKNFNLLTIIVMITFVTTMSKANTNKQLKAQSEEIYKEFEEVKDEIRGQHQAISAQLNARK